MENQNRKLLHGNDFQFFYFLFFIIIIMIPSLHVFVLQFLWVRFVYGKKLKFMQNKIFRYIRLDIYMSLDWVGCTRTHHSIHFVVYTKKQ